MNPKKKSMMPIIIGIASLLFALYLGAVVGMSMSEAQSSGMSGSELMDLITERLDGKLFDGWFIDDLVKQSMLIMGVVWFIAMAMLFGNKKNYIKGKEYGTAHWASLSDIRPLLSNTIKASQLKDAKLLKTRIGTKILENKRRKKWKRNRTNLYNAEIKILKERQEKILHEVRQIPDVDTQKSYVQSVIESAITDHEKSARLMETLDKATKRSAVIKVMQSVQQQEVLEKKAALQAYCESVWLQDWEPARLKNELDRRLEEINQLAEQGIAVTDANKEQKIQEAKQNYAAGISKFRDYESQRYKITTKYDNADMILTQTERICLYNYLVNLNILVIGGSGCGKSRNFCMPNILQGHSSFVVTDPKGEILEKTGEFLKRKGYRIRVLNLDDKMNSDCYNPFKYIHPDRDGYEERILTLIQTIIANTTKDKSNSSDPFWENAEKLFLQALFFFVADGFSAEHRNINTVMELIAMLEIAEEKDQKSSGLDVFAEEFERRLNELDTVNHSAGTQNNGVKAWKEFRSKASGKTAKSIVISTVARLSALRPSGIRRMLSRDDMDLERLGEEKTAVFVVVPPVDDTFNFIAGMLFTQMFQELQYCALQVHKHDGQRCPVTVRFILDEFATTCVIPNFPKILAYARSLGIGIVPVIQSVEQLKTAYEKEWGSIVDNCSSFLYLGGDTTESSTKFVSDLLGKGTFDKRTTGRSRGRSGSSSENYDVIGRELMTPDEVRRLPKDECILIVNSRPPFRSKKFRYESHPNYILTSDADAKNSYYHTLISDDEVAVGKLPEAPENKKTQDEWVEIVKKRKQETMEQIDRDISLVTLDTDEHVILSGAANKLTRLEVANTYVDDGEQQLSLQDIQENELQIEKEVDAIIEQFLEEADAEKMELETDSEVLLESVVKCADLLSPADTSVPDGEEKDDLDEFFEEESAFEEDAVSSEVQNDLGDIVADQYDVLKATVEMS